MLEQISNHSNSFITGLKKLAAATVSEQSSGLEQDKLKAKTQTAKPCASKLEIQVGGKVVMLDFAEEIKDQAQKQQGIIKESPSNSPQVKDRSRVLDESVQKTVKSK